MSKITEKLVLEILSWIPIKFLLRLTPVCKAWHQLITANPDFANLHLNRSTKSSNSVLMLTRITPRLEKFYTLCSPDGHDLDDPVKLVLPFDDSPSGTFHRIVSSCNGILCFAISNDEPGFKITPKSSFYLWNPSTNEHLTVPSPPIPTEYGKLIRKRNFIDLKYGFGFHPARNEYKLVRILGLDSLKGPSHISVYTLGEEEWRVLGEASYIFRSVNSCNTLVGGAIHWNAKRMGADCWDLIVSFDIGDEVFGEISLPSEINPNEVEDVVVSELGGLLCYTCQFPRQGDGVHIWVMKEYGMANSWAKQYVIKLPMTTSWELYVEPLDIVDDGKVLYCLGVNHQLFLYNPRNNLIRERRDFSFLYRQVYPHVRSLTSPRINKPRKKMRLAPSCSD
ncbi:hypothetical protein ACHQM5_015882 [Ranunculus cassubicifolius]